MTNENLDTVIEEELKADANKKKRKKLIVRIVAGVSAVLIAITGLSQCGKKKSSHNNTPSTTTTTTTTSFGLDDMGDELTTNKTTTTIYNVVSGNIDPNKVVEQDGKYYKDATEASKAKNTTTSIDLKNDTLKTSNGKVYDKTTGYEIKDDTGKTIATGNLNGNGIPDGYAYDSVLKKYLPKAEVGKYVYADATYYDVDGTVVLKKNDIVLKETLEKAKKYFSTTKNTTITTTKNTTTKPSTTTKNTTTTRPSTTTKNTTTTTKSTTTKNSNQGVVNKDGTYTIFGLTFETKADYQQWVLQGYEGYVEADGIMISLEKLNNKLQKTK